MGSVGRGDAEGRNRTRLTLGDDTLDGSAGKMDWASVRERGESKRSREGDVWVGLSSGPEKEKTAEQVSGKMEGTCVGVGLKQKEETRQLGLKRDVEEVVDTNFE